VELVVAGEQIAVMVEDLGAVVEMLPVAGRGPEARR
jgi:hypothetical protein